MLAGLKFTVGCEASAKRQKVWRRVVQSPAITVPRYASLTAADQVYVIGSCFANEIRAVLERVGVKVHPAIDPRIGALLMDELKIDPSWGRWDERAHYQCFTPFSICQEIELALGVKESDPETILECRFKGKTAFMDPFRRSVYASSRADALEIRERMSERIKQGLDKAKVIVMTLGLVESFQITGWEGHLAEYSSHVDESKLRFVNASYDQVLQVMTRALDLLFSAFPEKHVVLTVSPIPVARTFSGADAVTATMRAKSILRSCADTLTCRYPAVTYWPSYEYAMWSGTAFRSDDLRHIRPAAVREITSAFCRSYFSESLARRVDAIPPDSPAKLHRDASTFLRLPKWLQRRR
ncbi:GSCFA family protein [Rosistilla oblonga]|uniref:GSCFA domain-containing protein n=1 Tax=Rosistilla oblonga TaxID=2527990 RepID=UPI0011888F3D|nr:GSCFA domain-containing protein [Rosistilla oblonga]QDV11932.1 GSCFA family protein [Rosistilla oblonga]